MPTFMTIQFSSLYCPKKDSLQEEGLCTRNEIQYILDVYLKIKRLSKKINEIEYKLDVYLKN